ncbi:hypothetical protein [Methylocystis parvus]|uniref:Uncharacterized protein n=1 Tax=Methylocystis parvus TaxID=134 RepID=A0A6B8M7Q1_9HYPH|nr:hypothetical protein [Methylocystis parvus]QGM97363.1 hypothetical protein F7D14_07670 [Methylocystis parvus]WBJ98725.1 hypothetical protein MMG94_11945 [Methylocystis parvus OBBP]
MARAQTAYLERSSVPDRKALQAAIKALGFKLVVEDSYRPLATKGYVSCTLDGEDAGFDLRFAEIENPAPDLAALLGPRDVAMNFRWAGDPREHYAVIAVCAALAEAFGAIVWEPEGAKLSTRDDLVAMAERVGGAL